MSDAEKEREAISLLCGTVDHIPAMLRRTPYRQVTVTLMDDGGHEIEYAIERLDHHKDKTP